MPLLEGPKMNRPEAYCHHPGCCYRAGHDGLHSTEKENHLLKLFTLRPRAEYHEDYGTVLWWTLPIEEPPMVGDNPDEWYGEGGPTHFSPLPDPRFMTVVDSPGPPEGGLVHRQAWKRRPSEE